MNIICLPFNWLLYSFYCLRRTDVKGFCLLNAYASLTLPMFIVIFILFIFNVFSPLFIFVYCVIIQFLLYYTTFYKKRYVYYFQKWIKQRYFPVKFAKFIHIMAIVLFFISFGIKLHWYWDNTIGF